MNEGNAHSLFEGAEYRTIPKRGLLGTTKNQGDPSCPCLSVGDVDPITYENIPESTVAILGRNRINLTSYGFGCAAHDLESAACADWNACMASNATDCNKQLRWCSQSSCFVNPDNCALLKTPSVYFPESGRHNSYATCGDVDIFTSAMIVSKLSGKNLKIGLNSNPGGFLGAYQKDKLHFTGPLDTWHGPILDFVLKAAVTGNFTVELVEPPEVIRNRSIAYWGKSPFDQCVYAAALGYVDLCISTYVITTQRASVTPWVTMTERSLYLVVSDDAYNVYFGLRGFASSLGTIFLPFTIGTWVFLICFVIPLMGGLFVLHEYKKPNSPYQPTATFLVADKESEDVYVENRKVPLYHSIGRSAYMAYLSILQLNYTPSIVSAGAKFHLFGMAFFILTLTSVYVANLASIMTQRVNKAGINSLGDAIDAGYRICGTRKMYEVVTGIYKLPSNAFAKDPIELGGDGLPGFDCPKCSISTRGIEYLDPVKAETDENYCHAALSFAEGLESFHAEGKYCNLKFVGASIALVPDGLPVFEGISRELVTHFYQEKNRGLWASIRDAAKPPSTCAVPQYNSTLKNAALTIFDLAGIWSVSCLFIFLGVLITCAVQPCLKRRGRKKKLRQAYHVHSYNQHGEKFDNEEESEAIVSWHSSLRGEKDAFNDAVNDAPRPKRPRKYVVRRQPTTLSTESHASLGGTLRSRFEMRSPETPRAGTKRKGVHKTVSACDDKLKRKVSFQVNKPSIS